MSKVTAKTPVKKNIVKDLKKSKTVKPVKVPTVKITILPVDLDKPPFVKLIQNKNTENNLKKIVWTNEELWNVYSDVIQKNKVPNFSVYTK